MKILALLFFLLAHLGFGNQVALYQATFYQGKTVTVILGGPPAGTADLCANLHLREQGR